MLEIKILSLFVGSLGFQALVVSGWLRWQQSILERQCDEEEETLTPYESKDTYIATDSLQVNASVKQAKDPRLVGWEFKIVRAQRDLFRDPSIFNHLCREEAESGWILLEKLDDRRVRFKRPISLREIIRSDCLPHDPYRTHYGPASNTPTLLLSAAFLTVIVLPVYLGYALVNTMSPVAASRSNQLSLPSQRTPLSVEFPPVPNSFPAKQKSPAPTSSPSVAPSPALAVPDSAAAP